MTSIITAENVAEVKAWITTNEHFAGAMLDKHLSDIHHPDDFTTFQITGVHNILRVSAELWRACLIKASPDEKFMFAWDEELEKALADRGSFVTVKESYDDRKIDELHLATKTVFEQLLLTPNFEAIKRGPQSGILTGVIERVLGGSRTRYRFYLVECYNASTRKTTWYVSDEYTVVPTIEWSAAQLAQVCAWRRLQDSIKR